MFLSPNRPRENLSENNRTEVPCLSVETKMNEKESDPEFILSQDLEKKVNSDYKEIKIKQKQSPSHLNSSEVLMNPSKKKDQKIKKLLSCSNTRIKNLLSKLKFLEQKVKQRNLKENENIDIEKVFQNHIKNLKYQFRNSSTFEKNQIESRKGKDCLVCSTSNCIYDEDVLIYCECCSIMVHRMCVNLEEHELDNSPWYCASCKYQKQNEDLTKRIKMFFNHKIKNKIISPIIIKNLKILLQKINIKCITCGRKDGVFFEFEGLNGEFCHASCAYWLDELTINSKSKKVLFLNEDDLCQRIERDEYHNKKMYLNKKYHFVKKILIQFFEKKLKKKKDLIKYLKEIFNQESLNNNEIKKKSFIKSARRKKMMIRKEIESDLESSNVCNCLFSAENIDIIKKSIFQIIHEKLNKNSMEKKGSKLISKKFKNNRTIIFETLMNQLKNLLSFSSIFKFENFSDNNKKNKYCKDCKKPKTKKCRICNESKGIMVECYNKSCNHMLHVECARRVNCELGFPLKNLSNEMIHTVFCDIHSNSPGHTTRRNFKKIKKKEILNIENQIKYKWKELLNKRDSSEINNNQNNENINFNLKKNFSKKKQLTLTNSKLFLKKHTSSDFTFSLLNKKKNNNNSNYLFKNLNRKVYHPKKSIIWNLKKIKKVEKNCLLKLDYKKVKGKLF